MNPKLQELEIGYTLTFDLIRRIENQIAREPAERGYLSFKGPLPTEVKEHLEAQGYTVIEVPGHLENPPCFDTFYFIEWVQGASPPVEAFTISPTPPTPYGEMMVYAAQAYANPREFLLKYQWIEEKGLWGFSKIRYDQVEPPMLEAEAVREQLYMLSRTPAMPIPITSLLRNPPLVYERPVSL